MIGFIMLLSVEGHTCEQILEDRPWKYPKAVHYACFQMEKNCRIYKENEAKRERR